MDFGLRILKTIDSPYDPGMTEVLTAISSSFILTLNLPSWDWFLMFSFSPETSLILDRIRL